MLDSRRVRRNFDRAAGDYDRYARLQREAALWVAGSVVANLAEGPARVLDVGCGTGFVGCRIERERAGTRLVLVDFSLRMLQMARRPGGLQVACADALRLPLASACFDAVASSLMLQWCRPAAPALAEMCRVLKPGGWLHFATLGAGTLEALRAAWAEVDEQVHVNRFQPVEELSEDLERVGFVAIDLGVERRCLAYDSVPDLMRELQSIGARNADMQRPQGLLGRARYARLLAAYPATAGVTLAHYELILGMAQKKSAGGGV